MSSLKNYIESNIRRVYRPTRISWHIDEESFRSGKMRVRGWTLGHAKKTDLPVKVEIEVRDQAGKLLSAKCIQRIRPDVNKAFLLPQYAEYESGFELTWDSEGAEDFQICFSLESCTKKQPVSVRHIHFMERESRRYYKDRREMRQKGGKELRADNRYCIRTDGLRAYLRCVKHRLEPKGKTYEEYFLEHRPSADEMERQRRKQFDYAPQISIAVPLYNTPLKYLEDLLESVRNQTYQSWELCLADGSTDDSVEKFIKQYHTEDSRIQYGRLKKNQGIAGNTNEALSMASGEYIMLADHDDILELDALYEMAAALNEDREIDIVYTDEDLVDAGGTVFSDPRYKPDYNPDFLCCINYICHIFMVRRSILDQVGGFREAFDGAQDYDLILRCCEQTQKICHVPKILYHWRAHPDSTAGDPKSKMYAVDAGKRALEEHYQRTGVDAEVEYTGLFIVFRTIRKIKGEPLVSILIPNKDHTEDLDKCISSIEEKTVYQNYEIVVIENNSEKKETFAYYDRIQQEDSRVRVVVWEEGFNYSKINNFGARYARGDYFLLLNNDIEVISPTWMSDMLGYCQREDVGAVGAKLYYEDDTIQHAGIVLGVGGFAGHILTGEGPDDVGYFGRLKAIQDISAVTAACVMVKRSVYEEIGGFDESFAVALNDVDLCMKIRAAGYLIVFHPWAELHHYESKSRGYEDSPEKHERFKREIRHFREKWKDELEKGDPYYNVNLTLDRGDCSIRREDERFEIIEEIEREKSA